MDSFSRFPSAYPVPDVTILSAIIAFEATLITQFWPPDAGQGDQAFNHNEFKNYHKLNGTIFRLVPSRKHHKNTLESKHGTIRSNIIKINTCIIRRVQNGLGTEICINLECSLRV